MRVAFDGACLAAGPITGVGRSFLDALAAYAAAGTAECLLLLPDGVDPPPCPGLRVVAAPRGALRRQLALPALLRSLGADLLHSPVAAVPLRAPCPTIATVHDLPWLHEELGEPSSAWRRFATRLALRAASAVIAPSAMTAADAARLLGDRGPPLHVVPHGTELGPAPDAASVA
ncbi:MAG: glycosyltransferase family 4 protein, partial [Planctomycetes bacterium]|nr:glycosyltransferase family 4 protein [Planctomycetota bacterium]